MKSLELSNESPNRGSIESTADIPGSPALVAIPLVALVSAGASIALSVVLLLFLAAPLRLWLAIVLPQGAVMSVAAALFLLGRADGFRVRIDEDAARSIRGSCILAEIEWPEVAAVKMRPNRRGRVVGAICSANQQECIEFTYFRRRGSGGLDFNPGYGGTLDLLASSPVSATFDESTALLFELRERARQAVRSGQDSAARSAILAGDLSKAREELQSEGDDQILHMVDRILTHAVPSESTGKTLLSISLPARPLCLVPFASLALPFLARYVMRLPWSTYSLLAVIPGILLAADYLVTARAQASSISLQERLDQRWHLLAVSIAFLFLAGVVTA